jgi:hypothetical protein
MKYLFLFIPDGESNETEAVAAMYVAGNITVTGDKYSITPISGDINPMVTIYIDDQEIIDIETSGTEVVQMHKYHAAANAWILKQCKAFLDEWAGYDTAKMGISHFRGINHVIHFTYHGEAIRAYMKIQTDQLGLNLRNRSFVAREASISFNNLYQTYKNLFEKRYPDPYQSFIRSNNKPNETTRT